MFVVAIEIKIYIEWSFSLKDKRQVRYKLRDKIKNKFNVSIMETADQDNMKTLVFGISGIALNEKSANELAANIEEFILNNAEAEIQEFNFDIIKY